MSYCPKCGNKVDETMAFCPRCGASLRPAPTTAGTTQPYPQRNEKAEKNEKQEKREKNEHREKGEKQEKGEYGFVGFLIGGLVLIVLALFALLRLTGYIDNGMSWAILLLILGVIIIVTAIYVASTARRHFPAPNSQ
jgi:VIT1/CCC1 family predicted Fe2+/Mn2+ transporter